jgi:hypothetical protein
MERSEAPPWHSGSLGRVVPTDAAAPGTDRRSQALLDGLHLDARDVPGADRRTTGAGHRRRGDHHTIATTVSSRRSTSSCDREFTHQVLSPYR